MADKTLLEIHKKLYDSENRLAKGGMTAFMEAAEKVLTPVMLASKIKTDAFIAAIPADFNLSKIPKELREQLKNYTVEAKARYSEAAKNAGRFDSTDPRYQAAVDEMNRIRTGFENLAIDFASLKKYRDDNLLNHDNRSQSVMEGDYRLQNELVDGTAFQHMTISDDGLHVGGEYDKYFRDIVSNTLEDVKGTQAYLELKNNTIASVTTRNSIFNTDVVQDQVAVMFKGLGAREGTAFAYDGLLGDASNKSSFIDKYIQGTLVNSEGQQVGLNITKFDANGNITEEYKNKYEELKNPSAFHTYKGVFADHLIDTLRNVHENKRLEFEQHYDDQLSLKEQTGEDFGGYGARNVWTNGSPYDDRKQVVYTDKVTRHERVHAEQGFLGAHGDWKFDSSTGKYYGVFKQEEVDGVMKVVTNTDEQYTKWQVAEFEGLIKSGETEEDYRSSVMQEQSDSASAAFGFNIDLGENVDENIKKMQENLRRGRLVDSVGGVDRYFVDYELKKDGNWYYKDGEKVTDTAIIDRLEIEKEAKDRLYGKS